jgi:DNA-binding winged helix-turn-helix (wHTH) protein/tetratricopeptide (TPR) repeat protein
VRYCVGLAEFILPASKRAYRFADFLLVPSDKQLLRDGQPVALAPKLFDALLLLVEGGGYLVEKQELIDRLWPGTFVQEDSLAQIMSQLRKRLRGKEGKADLIETVPKRGFRFVARLCQVELPPRSLSAEVHQQAPCLGPTAVTLGVLPFENIGGDPEQQYLADGLTEETITSLGRVDPGHLALIGRTSVMAYRRTNRSLAEIGREIGAELLLESSIRAENGRLRITSKLIQVCDQAQVWSASYDADPGSVLEFQRELSMAIEKRLRVQLLPERVAALERRQTWHLQAYDFYLRGRYFWNQLSPATNKRALEYYKRATEADPYYALAWSGVADAYSSSPINSDAPPTSAWAPARDAAARAVAAEPNLAEAQTSLGLVKFWFDWDWRGAEVAFRTATELDPSYALAHRMAGIALSHMGEHEEALSAIQRARELDPLLASHHALSSQVAFNARDYSEALRFARQATVLDPEFWIGYMQLAQAYERLGQTDLALDVFNTASRLCGGNSKTLSCRGYILARAGLTEEAREVLSTLEAVGRERYVPPYALALVYAGLGQIDEVRVWLERAYEARDVHLVFLPVDAKWDVVREDSGVQAILANCGFQVRATPKAHGGAPTPPGVPLLAPG